MNDLEELANFLEARAAEDEAAAREAAGRSSYGWSDNAFTEAVELAENEGAREVAMRHIARHDPARVLRECEAKRATVAHLRTAIADEARAQRGLQRAGPDNREAGEDELAATRTRQAVECIAKHVAQVYADHEQFREEWQE